MKNCKTTVNISVDSLGLLTIVFIALKLTDTIDWSWWWVLSPTLIPLGILLGIAIIAALILLWTIIKHSGGKYQ